MKYPTRIHYTEADSDKSAKDAVFDAIRDLNVERWFSGVVGSRCFSLPCDTSRESLYSGKVASNSIAFNCAGRLPDSSSSSIKRRFLFRGT